MPKKNPNLNPPADAVKLAVAPKPEKSRERQALLSQIKRQIATLDTCILTYVSRYIAIEIADHGCSTPAEDFITTMVLHHSTRPITPDEAAEMLETFREDFAAMVGEVKNFTSRYPEFVKSA